MDCMALEAIHQHYRPIIN